MSVRLTDRPPLPGMPKPGQLVHIDNQVRHHHRIRGSRNVHEAIEREIQEIRLLLGRFQTLAVTGQLQIVVYPTTYTLSGELTAYHASTSPPRDALLREIDQRLFRLKATYGLYIGQIEFSLVQTFSGELDLA